MRKCVYLIMLFSLLAGGCSSKKVAEDELANIPLAIRDGLPSPSGGFVMVVCGERITVDEVIEPALEYFRPLAQESSPEVFKAQAKRQVDGMVTSRISDIVLYDRAREDMSEGMESAVDKIVEGEVRRFLVGFGNDYAKAETSLKEKGMDWEKFREYQKKMILSQSYISSKIPKDRHITYSGMMNYYNAHKEDYVTDPMIQFRLIDIDVEKVIVAGVNESKSEKAQKLAKQLSERLKKGEDFGELAKKYSNGYRASYGGRWKPVRPNSLAEPYDILAISAEDIEAGQTAGPIEAGGHIFIMKLEEKQEHSMVPFEKVQKQIEAKITFERRKEAIDELSETLMRQAAVSNKEAFVQFCLEEIYRRCVTAKTAIAIEK